MGTLSDFVAVRIIRSPAPPAVALRYFTSIAIIHPRRFAVHANQPHRHQLACMPELVSPPLTQPLKKLCVVGVDQAARAASIGTDVGSCSASLSRSLSLAPSSLCRKLQKLENPFSFREKTLCAKIDLTQHIMLDGFEYWQTTENGRCEERSTSSARVS